ncbi:MAG: hypothetical protein JWM11_119 [Planctomycetaceae bacterium]|nr:hypothetical protein [Planctomycetaceae bacterium]
MFRAFVMLCLLIQAAGVSAQTQVAGWHTDLASACKLARETGKPLFVVFRCVR